MFKHLILVLILVSCGQNDLCTVHDLRTVHGISMEVQPYLDEYLQHKGSPLNYPLAIQIVDKLPNSTWAAVCTKWGEYRQIEIRRDIWDSSTYIMKLSLVFHELGHCDLNRKHDDTTLANEEPSSYMYPSMFVPSKDTQGYYSHELFNPSK